MAEELTIIKKSTLKRIADAIRGRTGSSETIKGAFMASRISSIQTAKENMTGSISLVSFDKKCDYRAGACMGCRLLTDVDLGGISYIPDECFKSALASGCVIHFTTETTSVGADAFLDCTRSREIDYSGSLGQWVSTFFSNAAASPLYATKTAKLLIDGEQISGSIALENESRIGAASLRYTGIWALKSKTATSVDEFAISYCDYLEKVKFESIETIGERGIATNKALTFADLGKKLYEIGSYAFSNDYSLSTLIIRNEGGVVSLKSATAFDKCYRLIGTTDQTYNPSGATGNIYVPDALVERYKKATNWSKFADIISPLSECLAAYDDGDLARFRIDGTAYVALEDWTVKQWCDSDKNTIGLFQEGASFYVNKDSKKRILLIDGKPATKELKITQGLELTTEIWDVTGLSTATVAGQTIYFESGATWKTWCSSRYNTIGMRPHRTEVFYPNGIKRETIQLNGSNVSQTSAITAGANYTAIEGSLYGTITVGAKTYTFEYGVIWEKWMLLPESKSAFMEMKNHYVYLAGSTDTNYTNVKHARGTYVTCDDYLEEEKCTTENHQSLPWI